MVIDGDRGGMDADHGGGTGDEKKLAGPGVRARPEPDQDAESASVGKPDADPDPPPATDTTEPSPEPSPAASAAPGAARRRPGAGMAALSLPYQIVAALALSLIGLVACAHIAMIFLHVAPSNTLTKQHGEVVDDWVYPEFEQNWKLFAPNPLQQNVSVHVRAELASDGADSNSVTHWINLSREDGEAIRGNFLPSHVDQNELRRAWDFYTGSHDSENHSTGLRGELSELYIRRIVMLRLAEHGYGGTVERIQVRSAVRHVGVPTWSDEKISTKTEYRELPWWNVSSSDLSEAAATDRSPQAVTSPQPQAGTSPQTGEAGK
ncbi:DUF5819 family protein [Streptomyces sp. NBC_01201]|uniref:DUF5819 family protein n=2 Tax=Streptomyces TaxID=1883 RepID=A0ABY9JCI8_9ACTN|nr:MULTISPECIES: DUF5819 family protein [unclassified Streptomyces]WSQ78811.1 DUF5819 family protein [Streptomyces sp. NBC_01213]TXS17079.1 hypothetical protein EAO68_04330 [Streptomyces sp. wa22]WLQ65430.1 DUF5819 family protein [Streptomyces sp. Alt3]WSQ86180.1 DUF5819 family protein [Streptomyces sp. NBC_01212]WSR49524.1 DUF5819 family protein [Streptomyces sp. NBC_01201]